MEIQQKSINFSQCEYCRRVAVLQKDGYRVQFDRRYNDVWVALLVHHNGNRITLSCYPLRDTITQKTNNLIVYNYNGFNKTLCKP